VTRFRDLDPAEYALPARTREKLLSPALVVYLDKVRENVQRILAYAGTPDRWRPHIKTTKIPAVYSELIQAGVRHFKCATTREARVLLEVLEEAAVPDADLLLAYPLRGPGLEVLAGLARKHSTTRVSLLCEDPGLIDSIPQPLSIFVDVNPGMDRTGVPLADRDRLHAVVRGAGGRFRGIHYYDGHLHGPIEARQDEVFACYDLALELCRELRELGFPPEEIITSGTPAFLHALAYPRFRELGNIVHRLSPGTVVFHDLRSEQENPDLQLTPAALLFTRVISRPRTDLATCDVGSKSIAAEGEHVCAFVLGHAELEPQIPNEEHLPLRAVSAAAPDLGTELMLIPHHVCPTVNLAEQVLLVDGEKIGTAVVTARAHDLLA